MCVADESSVVAFVESMAVEMMMSPLGRSPPPPFIGSRRGGVHVRGDLRSRRLPPESWENSGGLLLKVRCRAWRRAWLSSLEAFSHAWNVSWSCGIRGRHGDSCRTCRPLRLTGRSVEGVSDGGLLLISSRTLFEGRCPCSPRVLQRRKYRGLAVQW